MCVGIVGVVVKAVGRIDRAVRLGERAVQRDERGPFFPLVRAVFRKRQRQKHAGKNLRALLHQLVGIGKITALPSPREIQPHRRARIEQLRDAEDHVVGALLRARRLVEDLNRIVTGDSEIAEVQTTRHEKPKKSATPNNVVEFKAKPAQKQETKVAKQSVAKKAQSGSAADMIPFDDDDSRGKVGTTDGF